MLRDERHRRILKLLQERTSISVKFLQEDLQVTPMTLWRDLKLLEEEGLLKRTRGGVMHRDVEEEPRFDAKVDAARTAKVKLAKYAARNFIKDGDIIALEGGTTVAELCRQLPVKNLTVLSNSLPVVYEIYRNHPNVVVYCSGGLLREESGTLVGKEAVTFFSKRKVGTFFMSASGIDLEFGLTDPNPMEIEVKQAMARAAERIILLLDSSKIGKSSLMKVLPLGKVSELVTEEAIPPEFVERLKAAGVRVTVV